MNGWTTFDIVRSLFDPKERTTPHPDPRTDVLVAMVFDLLMEVEALRAAQLTSSGDSESAKSGYGQAYRDTAYLTHNNCGPWSGIDKLLFRFYPQGTGEKDRAPSQGSQLGRFLRRFLPSETTPKSEVSGRNRTWRECLMLSRLGFSEDQIREFLHEAEQAHSFT